MRGLGSDLGRHARLLSLGAFALLSLALLLPYPGNLANFLVREGSLAPAHDAVQQLTLHLVTELFALAGEPPLRQTTGIDGYPVVVAAGFAVRISPACAGYQGVLACLAFLSADLYLHRRRFAVGRGVALALAASALIFLLNAFRIGLLLYIGAHHSPTIAVQGFHSNFGAVALLGVTAAAALLLRTRLFQRSAAGRAGPPPAPEAPGAFAAGLARAQPLAIVLALGFVTGLPAGPIHWLYPLPVLVGALLLPRWRAEWHGSDPADRPLVPIAAGVACYLLWIALVPRDPDRDALMQDSLDRAPAALAAAWVTARLLGSALIMPVLEELAFRGGIAPILAHAARARLGPRAPQLAVPLAVAGSALLFGLMHQEVLAAVLVGIAYGTLRFSPAGLGGATLAHVTTNTLLGAHVLITGGWSYW